MPKPGADSETFQRILDAGQGVITHQGYAAVGLNAVLAAAGVPKGSFYHYFDSKDAFGEAMLDRYFDEYLANMDRLFAEGEGSSGDRLMRYWQSFYDIQILDGCQGRCLAVKLGAEVSDLSESMRASLVRGTGGIVERIGRIIEAGLADGSISSDGAPDVTAEALYDLWLGASVMAKIHRSPRFLERALTTTRGALGL